MKTLNAILFTLAAMAAVGNALASPGDGEGKGVSNCNCDYTATETGATVSHSATVGVSSVDTPHVNYGNQSTGQSGAAYSNQSIPPRTCLYVTYEFTCAQVGGNWVCALESFHESSRPVQGSDCP